MTYSKTIMACVELELKSMTDANKQLLCTAYSEKTSENDLVLSKYRSDLISRYGLTAVQASDCISRKILDMVVFVISSNQLSNI